MQKSKIRILIFLMICTWSAGIFSPLFLTKSDAFGVVYIPLKSVYSLTCHQKPERSIVASSVQFFVCARCTGIYTGALIVSVISLAGISIRFRTLKPLMIFSLPMLVDVLMLFLGIYNYSHFIAFITGSLFGSVVFIYILDAIEKSFLKQVNNE